MILNVIDLLLISIILILLKKQGANLRELTTSCLIYVGVKWIVFSIFDLL